MKKLVLSSIVLFCGTAAHAAYPVACQLDMLATASPALRADNSVYTFFDLNSVTFAVSQDDEPLVRFEGKAADLASNKTCVAEVTMEVPEETLGCPTYKVKSILSECSH